MVPRREFIRATFGVATAAALGAVCGPTTAVPPASQRRYRIGYLTGRVAECVTEPRDWQVANGVAIRAGRPSIPLPDACAEGPVVRALEERGYRLGENLEWITVSPAKIGPATQPDLVPPAAAVVALEVDVIIAQASNAAFAAKEATATIPIVVNSAADVVEAGLVASLARPGGNITGVSTRVLETGLKRVEVLREAFPRVKSPILVYGIQPSNLLAIGPGVESARKLGLSPVAIQLTDEPGFLLKARRALDDGADSLVVFAPLAGPGPATVLAFVREHRLPAVFIGLEYHDQGAVSFYASTDDFPSKVAEYVDRILNGANPGDLPIVGPTTWELVVNLKVADALGTKIASSVVARATRIVK